MNDVQDVCELRRCDPVAAWGTIVDWLRFRDPIADDVWLDHFVGRYADAHPGATACLLWDLARRHPAGGEMPPDWEDAEGVCTGYVRERSGLYQTDAEKRFVVRRTEAAFAVARAALALRDRAAGAAALRSALWAAVRGYDDSTELSVAAPAVDLPPHLEESGPTPGWGRGYVTQYLRALAGLAAPDALAMTERGLFWLLGEDATGAPKRALILLVRGPKGSEKGTVADLVASRWESQVSPREAVFFADPVACGVLHFDAKWADAFERARLAASGRRGPTFKPCCYRVAFELPRLAELMAVSDADYLRPYSLGGASASATAACLLLAHADGPNVDPDYCLTAKTPDPPDAEQLGPVGGRGHKLAGLAEALSLFRPATDASRPELLTRILPGDPEADALRLVMARIGMRWRPVETLNAAYEILTRRDAALRSYAATERRALFGRLKQFFPQRVLGAIGDGQPEIMDAMNVPLELGALRHDGGATAHPEPAVDLDRRLDDWLATFDRGELGGPMAVVGEPGAGKTWLGLRRHFRLLRDAESGGGPQWLSLWLSCSELGAGLRETDDARSAAELVCDAAARRFDRDEPDEETRGAFRDLLDRRLGGRRLVLIADAWDEGDAADAPRLTRALREWARERPLLVTSRLAGHEAVVELFRPVARATIVRLARLARPAGLIEKWFGGPNELSGRLAADAALEELARVPFHAALLCHLWEWEGPAGTAELPTRPTQLVLRVIEVSLAQSRFAPPAARRPLLERLLRLFARPAADGSAYEAVANLDRLELFTALAFNTVTGPRWGFTEAQFDTAVAGVGGDFPNIKRAAKALLDLGLFTDGPGRTFSVIHQSFAEVLCARAAVEFHGLDMKRFRGRLLDPRFREVWCHAAALVPDVSPLLTELRDDGSDEALSLAGDCLAARGRDWDTDPGRGVVQRLLDRWAATDFHPDAAAARTFVRLARAGCTKPIAESICRTTSELPAPGQRGAANLPIQRLRALFETLAEVAPAEAGAFCPLLIDAFRVSLREDCTVARRGVAQAALDALAWFGPAADGDELIELLRRVYAAQEERFREWILPPVRSIRPSAAAVLEGMPAAPSPVKRPWSDEEDGRIIAAIRALAAEDVGEQQVGDLRALVRRAVEACREEEVGGRQIAAGKMHAWRAACELLATHAERAGDALTDLVPLAAVHIVNLRDAAADALGRIAMAKWGERLDRAAKSPESLRRELAAIRAEHPDLDTSRLANVLAQGKHPVLANWVGSGCERLGLRLDGGGALRFIPPRPLAEVDPPDDTAPVAQLW